MSRVWLGCCPAFAPSPRLASLMPLFSRINGDILLLMVFDHYC